MKRRIVSIALLAVVVLILCVPALRGAVFTPLQTAVSTATGRLRNWIGGEWKIRYEAVQTALNTVRREQIELERLQHENAWYRTFLGLKTARDDVSLCDAVVIAVDAADRYAGFTVNRGSLDGICAGMPVITADGVIGITHTVGLNWAQIRTVYHPDVTVSVMVHRTAEIGHTDGGERDTRTVTVVTLPRDSMATVGDIVTTAGIGGVYPAALPIGEIRSVQRHRDGVSDMATVAVYATVTAADRVMIVTDFSDKLRDER